MKHTIEGYIKFEQYSWDDKPTYFFSMYENSESSDCCIRATVMKHSFEVDIPENFDPTPGAIAQLKAEKENLRANFAARVAEIDARINSLLAIEA